MAQPLSDQQRREALANLPGWAEVLGGKAISRSFVFGNFREAFGFMTQVALAAEAADHHPDWRNVYKTVEVELSTHDAGGVTTRDIALAGVMNKVARQFGLA